MSQNIRTHNSGQEGGSRRNNPPPYNLHPLQPQEEEQKGNKQPPMARRQMTRRQPRREKRTECLEQRIDTLTELVDTLVTAWAKTQPTRPLPSLRGSPLLTRGARRVYLFKGTGKSSQTRPRPTLMYVEGALGVDVERGGTVEETGRTYKRPNALGIRYLIGSSE